MSNTTDPAKDSAGTAKAPTAAKTTVLSERDVPGVGKVRVVTDGRRTWKEAPAESGLGPRK